MESVPAPLIPAATVILLREQDGRLEVLMLRRNRQLISFGGAWVFPGGRVDEADFPGGSELKRAQAAAVRETHEETGLDISGKDLATLSCWIPPVQEKRRFSTWFFIVSAPDTAVQIDQGEIHDYRWVCPKELIAQIPTPDIMIMPPTYVSLHSVAQHKTVEDVLNATHQETTQIFETKFQRIENGFVTMWEGDAGYETADPMAKGPRRRLVSTSESWDYLT